MDWQREMCGEVCRMDDRIAVVDDQGGWDVFDLGMNRLDGGEETDIETAKTRCEAWSKTSKYVDDTLYYYTGDPRLDDLHFVKENTELWGGFEDGLMYTAEWWEPNVTLTLQSATWGETWDWIAEDRNTHPSTHYMGQDFPSVASALTNFLRTTWGKLGVGVLRESRHSSKETRFDGCGPHRGSRTASLDTSKLEEMRLDDPMIDSLAEYLGWEEGIFKAYEWRDWNTGTCYFVGRNTDWQDINAPLTDIVWVWFGNDDVEIGSAPIVSTKQDDIYAALNDFDRYWSGRYIVTLDEMDSWQGPEWRPASRRGVEVPREPARGSQASISKQSSLASPSGNIYVNVDDSSGPYRRAIRDAVNVSPILDVYAMVYGPSWAYATAYMTYDYADPAVSNAYDKPTAWGWCIFDNWGPASNPTIISVSGPVFKTFASAASELERAMDESPVGEHTSQNFANSPRVPEEVDSKDDEPCPLCGSDHFDGKHCQTCGYDVAPDGLDDIDIDDLDEVEDVDQTVDDESVDSSDEAVTKDDGEDGASMSKASGWWDDDPRKVMYEDDIVVLYGPDGSVWYKGVYDYSPMHDDEDYESGFAFNHDNGRYEHSDGSWYEKVGERRCAEAADSTIVRCVVPGDDLSDYACMIVVRGTTDEGDAMATASDVIEEDTGMPPLSMAIERNVNFDEWQRDFPQSNYEVVYVR